MPAAAPRVSVVMPLYNREALVADSVRSVLDQTFRDLELIVVDDCSTDGSAAVVEALAREDGRIRLLRTPRNSRQAFARNLGIREARGELVALLDSDDLALPHRLARQVAYLDAHPDVQALGSAMLTFGAWDHVVSRATDPDRARCGLLHRSELLASTVLLRRDFLVRHDLAFDEAYPPSEDYDLWERIAAAGGRIANLKEVLVRYRVHPGSDSITASERQEATASRVRLRALRRLLPGLSEAEAAPFLAVRHRRPRPDAESLLAVERLVDRLVAANDAGGPLPRAALHRWASAFVSRCYHDTRRARFVHAALRASPAPGRVSLRTRLELLAHRLLRR